MLDIAQKAAPDVPPIFIGRDDCILPNTHGQTPEKSTYDVKLKHQAQKEDGRVYIPKTLPEARHDLLDEVHREVRMRIARERLARSRRPLLVRRRHRGRQLRGREQLALRGDGGDGLGELLGLLRRGDDHLGVRVGVGGGGDSGEGYVSEWMGEW